MDINKTREKFQLMTVEELEEEIWEQRDYLQRADAGAARGVAELRLRLAEEELERRA